MWSGGWGDLWIQLLNLQFIFNWIVCQFQITICTENMESLILFEGQYFVFLTPFFFAGLGLGIGFVRPSYRFIQILVKESAQMKYHCKIKGFIAI